MWIRFILYGLGGNIYQLSGKSAPTRLAIARNNLFIDVPMYGSIAIFYEPVHNFVRDFPWLVRALIWAIGFTAVKGLTGWIIAQTTGRCPWNYVAAEKRFAINPYIRWDFFIVWAIVGLALEPVHDLLVRLTPLVEMVLRGT
ncbi:MAG: hypothetical protein R3293_07380 [Candidatus Promineifilaceae bacterium]|nr:hypothetical protein [Candidatus Promineifilaceae bacterium]